MKRRAYISILFFSLMLLLAHSIVPHHHHDNMLIALVNSSEHARQVEAEHHGANPVHGDESCRDRCELGTAIVKSHRAGVSSDCGSDDNDVDGYSIISFYGVCVYDYYLLLCAQASSFVAKPYIANYVGNIVFANLQLRAPPFSVVYLV